jgi:hypothetical protein
MAIPFAAVAAGAGIGGSVAQWWLGNQAVDAARDAALEEERRREKERDFVLGETRARAGASGIEFDSGSIQSYLADMTAEFARQHSWAVAQANRAASLGKTANTLGLASGIGSALFGYSKSTNWFQSSPTAVR